MNAHKISEERCLVCYRLEVVDTEFDISGSSYRKEMEDLHHTEFMGYLKYRDKNFPYSVGRTTQDVDYDDSIEERVASQDIPSTPSFRTDHCLHPITDLGLISKASSFFMYPAALTHSWTFSVVPWCDISNLDYDSTNIQTTHLDT